MNAIVAHTRVIAAIREYRRVRDAHGPLAKLVNAWLEVEAALDELDELDEVEKNDV